MISMQHRLRQLVALQTGGLQVVTLLDGTTVVPENAPIYTGKRFEQKGIRTVVQPDIDVVTMLSPEVFEVDGLWEQHTAVVEEKLSIIYTLQQWIQQSWLAGLLFPIGWLFYNYIQVGFPDVWLYALESIVIAGIIYLSKQWIARGVTWLVGRYLRAQFQKYLG